MSQHGASAATPADAAAWLARARRLVVKVGSSSVADGRGQVRAELLGPLCASLVALMEGPPRRSAVLVTSGAIALGWPRLGLKRRPSTLPEKQAAAAVGQGLLMAYYEQAFARLGRPAAQVLLTADDLRDRGRFNHARRTMEALLARGAVPVVNENDTVAVDEIKVGDNDRLAAMVAVLVQADLLVLLSDVDGLYTADPRRDPSARLIPVVERPTDPALASLEGRAGPMGTGGMRSKVEAARMAAENGIPTLIARAAPDVLERVASGQGAGTLFQPLPRGLRGKKQWLAFYPAEAGTVVIDPGAAQALVQRGRSLLASGVVEVLGEFRAGSVVRLVTPGGQEVGRGIVSFGSADLRRIKGRRSCEIPALLGQARTSWEVVHRDNLVLTPPAHQVREEGA
ncbi:MAG TPA: glutamate 5-kinase [Limnochordales bacterium]